MKNRLSRKAVSLKQSGIRRFFEVASTIEGVISLGVGEPDFETPWRIRDEGIYSLQQGQTFYTANAGMIELRQALVDFVDQHYQLKYDPETEVVVTVGGSEAIDLAMRAIVNPGDEILYTEPNYVSYLPCIELSDGIPVPISLSEENGFKLTAEELLAKITQKTKALVLSYPNNPTGAIMTQEEFDKIAEVVIEKDILVITDEMYSELNYHAGKSVSIAGLKGMKERTIYINGFSKTFSMTGWRLGYAMAPSDIMEQMVKIHQFTVTSASTTSQLAGIEALKNCDSLVAEMRDSYNMRRRYLVNEFKKMAIQLFEPLGAFYIFPNISEFGLTSEEFANELLNREKVAVIPGTAFGDSGEGYIRISYAYSIADLQKAMVRFKHFVTELRAEQKQRDKQPNSYSESTAGK